MKTWKNNNTLLREASEQVVRRPITESEFFNCINYSFNVAKVSLKDKNHQFTHIADIKTPWRTPFFARITRNLDGWEIGLLSEHLEIAVYKIFNIIKSFQEANASKIYYMVNLQRKYFNDDYALRIKAEELPEIQELINKHNTILGYIQNTYKSKKSDKYEKLRKLNYVADSYAKKIEHLKFNYARENIKDMYSEEPERDPKVKQKQQEYDAEVRKGIYEIIAENSKYYYEDYVKAYKNAVSNRRVPDKVFSEDFDGKEIYTGIADGDGYGGAASIRAYFVKENDNYYLLPPIETRRESDDYTIDIYGIPNPHNYKANKVYKAEDIYKLQPCEESPRELSQPRLVYVIDSGD